MKARYLLAAGLLSALLLPAGASAATAGVGDFGGQMTAHYHAGPGEVNNVTVTASSGAVTFSDPGISMAPAPGFEGTFCTTPGTNTITCSHPDGIEYLEIQVKGGADKVNNSTSIGSQIYGGDQDDPDVLTGGSGNDAISDQGGADKLIGNGGSDELSGGNDADQLVGGPGNDDLIGEGLGTDPGADSLDGGSGSDFLDAGSGDFGEVLTGGPGNDYLYGRDGADTLNGGTDVDLLSPGQDLDADVLNGGPDSDIADYISNTTEAVRVSLDDIANDGPIVLGATDNVHSDIETVWGSPKADELIGNSATQSLAGFGGADKLSGMGGADALGGGDANDKLIGGPGADILGGDDGIDTADYSDHATAVVATIDGVANDGSTAEGDNVETDVENLTGGSHNDTLTGNGVANVLSGGDGGDKLIGGGADDILNGGGSNDSLNGQTGDDDFNGEAGFDTADYSASFLNVDVDLDDQADDGIEDPSVPRATEFDNVHGDVERVYGGGGDDLLVGNLLPNTLQGLNGLDTLKGAGGGDTIQGDGDADVINGGGGDDTVNASATVDGADTVAGGPGVDRASYAARAFEADVSLDSVANDGAPGEGDNVDNSVENVSGGAGADTLIGSDLPNTLDGGGGDDDLLGLAGADVLRGGANTDALDGGDNDDLLAGSTGPDVFTGGAGVDTADYSASGTGVDVTIDGIADDGAPAEGDNVTTTIENLIGGRFDDYMVGNGVDNDIKGGLGADDLRGANGADTLVGQPGADELRAGAGTDVVDALDGAADPIVSCGPDADQFSADAADTVNADCETPL